MQRAFTEFSRHPEREGGGGEVHLTLLGSDGPQLLLEIWDRLSLGDLGGSLHLAEGLHQGRGPALNPRVL